MRRLALILLTVLPTGAIAAPDMEKLGKELFTMPALSVTGTQSCASCHDAAAGFAAADPVANRGGGVVEGAVAGRFGNRKPPSIAYGALAPVLHHAMTSEGLTIIGGDFLDGRARGDVTGTALGDQAMGPFLNPLEMAMPDEACVVLRACQNGTDDGFAGAAPGICTAISAAKIDAACSTPDVKITLDDATRAKADDGFALIARALAAYERGPDVVKFTSRFDDWYRGTGTLNDQELAGYQVFTGKGKCSGCHVITPAADGQPPLFTDFTFDNIGLPKNPENPWYASPANPAGKAWIDKGLATTLRDDPLYAASADNVVSAFKVPTLRNLDARSAPDAPRAYGHNGYFKTIEGIVTFYNTRDVWPRCADWATTEEKALAQHCWPAPENAATMNTDELGNLKLTATEEADLVAFLKTLTDR